MDRKFNQAAGLLRALKDGAQSQEISLAQRQDLADLMSSAFPFDSLVPQTYAGWRPLVRDSIRFFVEKLSSERLLPKLREQLELSLTQPLEKRLLQLVSQMPALRHRLKRL